MPQIVSLLPAAAATPAATPVASTVAAAPDVLVPVDPTSPNFLAQFKSALKSLAHAVVLPQVTPHPTPDQATGPVLSPILDTSTVDDAKPTDAAVPQLLAQLGFVVVPTAFLMPPTPNAPVPTGPAPATTQVPHATGPQATAPLLSAPSAPSDLTGPSIKPVPRLDPIVGEETHVQVPVKAEATPLAPPPQLGPVASSAQGSPRTAPVLPFESNQPLAHLKPADLAQVPTPAMATAEPATPATQATVAASVILQPAAATNQPAAAAPAQPAPGAATPIVGPQLAAQGGSQASTTNSNGNGRPDHGARTAHKLAPIAAESAPVLSAPVADGAMAAAVTAPISGGALPVQVGPSEVVSQIARHADLMRLPGNRGLKIQLHPEDLGGVQVTVRYSASGGVELHINAEHAATGALVQAGWGELRDALATQGISADRLMLSVTGPTGPGQADLTGGGGDRSDQHSPGSNPGQSSQANLNSENGQGQARQDAPHQRGAQGGWSGPLDPISAPDGNLRVASATAAPSHIDYRV